jgi:hypothetical protein
MPAGMLGYVSVCAKKLAMYTRVQELVWSSSHRSKLTELDRADSKQAPRRIAVSALAARR